MCFCGRTIPVTLDFCTTAVLRTGNVSCKSSLYDRSTMLKVGGAVVICDVILGGGYELCVTCDKGEGGGKFSLKMRDVIYGQPPSLQFRISVQHYSRDFRC